MDKAIYTAMTGASAAMRLSTAVYHNLANVNTPGYKADLVGTEAFKVEGQGNALPTRVAATTKHHGYDGRQGGLQVTGNALDIALDEGVWLAVTDANGQEAYTRNGELKLNSNGLLETQDGALVQGSTGPVAIPPEQTITIGADGSLSVVPQGQGPETLAQIGRLKLVQFDMDQLSRGADGLFRPSGDAAAVPATGKSVTAGALETSNADPVTSLVQMIELQRKYETQVQLIKKADENARASSGLMRLS
ncbi:flagellar basal body rod protein FlgF [Pseudomarimonas arenosa]|uniref:Flagellar basal-body rod protein FlgF n=1 Tax=Pseudomarimonas arenosa TaxID=2774145 RepID=A0AAW3ZJ65_9GAMM|nr:flagellar basal body rod protein FlgF [Pseudomarimonas arenosa]MBD8524759.1 flagellar basal body rod protein FlgF [Pseudomarimonas arenosa]